MFAKPLATITAIFSIMLGIAIPAQPMEKVSAVSETAVVTVDGKTLSFSSMGGADL